MKKNECQYYLQQLSKFINKKRNMYAQQMSVKLKEKWDRYSFVCLNDEIEIKVDIILKK